MTTDWLHQLSTTVDVDNDLHYDLLPSKLLSKQLYNICLGPEFLLLHFQWKQAMGRKNHQQPWYNMIVLTWWTSATWFENTLRKQMNCVKTTDRSHASRSNALHAAIMSLPKVTTPFIKSYIFPSLNPLAGKLFCNITKSEKCMFNNSLTPQKSSSLWMLGYS